jgi:hypothetical protein
MRCTGICIDVAEGHCASAVIAKVSHVRGLADSTQGVGTLMAFKHCGRLRC